MWDGGRCIVIGGGPSLSDQFDIPNEVIINVRDKVTPLGPAAYSSYMEIIHNEHIIAVNNSYLLGEWIDICFFGDHGWYKVHRSALSQWPGLKVTCCPALADPALAKSEGIKYLARDKINKLGLSQDPTKVAWGFNSGSSAINLAVHLGVKQIILLGFDMAHSKEGNSHWHQGHGHKYRPNYPRFTQGFPVIAQQAAVLGIEILNASQTSVIDVFTKVRLKEVL
jgi:hypothetical protein